jgi:hypothetical protein
MASPFRLHQEFVIDDVVPITLRFLVPDPEESAWGADWLARYRAWPEDTVDGRDAAMLPELRARLLALCESATREGYEPTDNWKGDLESSGLLRGKDAGQIFQELFFLHEVIAAPQRGAGS